MEQVAERLARLSISETLAMTQKSRELQAKGYDVINLSIGEPDFDTPEHIKEAGKKAIDENFSHYTPVPGYQELREAVSRKFKRENNLDFSPEQIVVSNGAKHSIANLTLALLDDGDEVIIPIPYWVSYVDLVKLAGANPITIESSIENDFKVTPEQIEAAITPKTKAFLFSSPSNPTGGLYTKDELEAIANVFAKHERVIIYSDEIYEHINFDGKHESIAQFDCLKDQVVVINGVSKGYAMTGWRIGYVGAPLWIAKACTKLQGQLTSGASSIAQKASIEALDSPLSTIAIKEMLEVFRRRRDLVLDLLKDIPGLKANVPQGAFYVFPEISSFFGKSNGEITIENSTDLAMYLLNKVHVAVVAGSAFGDPKCIRLSYATSDEMLKDAISRIKKALAELK